MAILAMFNFKSRDNIFLWDYYENGKKAFDIIMSYILKRGVNAFNDFED